MSKCSEIQAKYNEFAAAEEAAKALKPRSVEILYEISPLFCGRFRYEPNTDIVRIYTGSGDRENPPGKFVDMYAFEIPALIKALRGFFE